MTPYAPARICWVAGCRHVVRHDHLCPTHGAMPGRSRWQVNRDPVAQAKRVRGRAGQALRQQQLEQEPWCRACAKQGLRTQATIRDHIVPLAEGGTDDPGNIQSLCRVCHASKTHEEGMRGRGR